MAAAAQPATTQTRPGQPRVSWRVDAVTMLLGTWLLVGLVVDGWAHNNLQALETFFTPWHAVFYSGFVATAGWVLATATRARQPEPSGLAAFPAGYGLAVVGVVIFAVGGRATSPGTASLGSSRTWRRCSARPICCCSPAWP